MSATHAVETSALGAIAIRGRDAATFLRAQLTNDVFRLGPDRHFMAGWCDAKGRAQMIAQVTPFDRGFLLVVPQGLIDGLMKRLRMYVLRAQVELEDMRDALDIHGMVGSDLPAANVRETRGDSMLLGLPATTDATPRALGITPAGERFDHGIGTADTAWTLQEIDAGLPTVLPATQGLFVPQMLNMHWLMAIDFDKGCYPGQEVIARLHYRGKLTRRLFRLAWHGDPPAPGDTIHDEEGTAQGTVVRSAESASETGRLLAVLKLAGAQRPLTCAHSTLERLELPYPTPD